MRAGMHAPAALFGETSVGSGRKAGRCDPASLHTPGAEENEKAGGQRSRSGNEFLCCPYNQYKYL